MSTQLVKDIVCPQCGESQKYNMYASINPSENPELKDLVLDETLFDWRCQRCNYFAAMAYPFIYSDPTAGYIVCCNPVGTNDRVEVTSSIKDFVRRSVKNLAELKEKILIFDSSFDDVALEIVKNALCEIIKKTYKVNSLHAYFSRINKDEIEFAIFLPKKTDPVYHSTKKDVYKQSQEVLRVLDYVDAKGFIKVNSKLARKLVEDYENL